MHVYMACDMYACVLCICTVYFSIKYILFSYFIMYLIHYLLVENVSCNFLCQINLYCIVLYCIFKPDMSDFTKISQILLARTT